MNAVFAILDFTSLKRFPSRLIILTRYRMLSTWTRVLLFLIYEHGLFSSPWFCSSRYISIIALFISFLLLAIYIFFIFCNLIPSLIKLFQTELTIKTSDPNATYCCGLHMFFLFSEICCVLVGTYFFSQNLIILYYFKFNFNFWNAIVLLSNY